MNLKHIEGFTFLFSGLDLNFKKCEIYSELNSSLREFVIEMVTNINDRETIIPISFRGNKDILNFDQLNRNRNKNKKLQKKEKEKENIYYNVDNNDGNIDTISLKEKKEEEMNCEINEDFIWKLKMKFFSIGNSVNSEIDFKLVIKFFY